MKRILSFTILLLSLSVALTSCENVDLGSSQTPKYGKLDIIDRALLPEILRDEWVLKGAGFKKPYIYEKSFSFEDKAEIPLKSIKGNGDNELTFNFTKNIPATFAGGHNFHGKLEYVPLESMEKASKVILNILSIFAGK